MNDKISELRHDLLDNVLQVSSTVARMGISVEVYSTSGAQSSGNQETLVHFIRLDIQRTLLHYCPGGSTVVYSLFIKVFFVSHFSLQAVISY